MKLDIESAVEKRPTKMTLHKGKDVKHGEWKANFMDWILKVRKRMIYVTKNNIICKATSLLPSLNESDAKKLQHWVTTSYNVKISLFRLLHVMGKKQVQI